MPIPSLSIHPTIYVSLSVLYLFVCAKSRCPQGCILLKYTLFANANMRLFCIIVVGLELRWKYDVKLFPADPAA